MPLSERTAFADSRRAQFLGEIAAKAAAFNGAADKISKRAALQKGNSQTFMVTFAKDSESNSDPVSNAEKVQGWGSQGSQKLPKKLQNRMIEVSAAFSSHPPWMSGRHERPKIAPRLWMVLRKKAAANSERVASVQSRRNIAKG